MHIAFFGQSVLADWDNGSTHYVRGLIREFIRLGHEATFYESRDNWAVRNQVERVGRGSLQETFRVFPFLRVRLYRNGQGDQAGFLSRATQDVDVAVVMSGADPALVRSLPGALKQSQTCLFYNTHHWPAAAEDLHRGLGLERYGGVIAASSALADFYRSRLGLERVFVLPLAADAELFYPRPCRQDIDVLLIANRGDGDREEALRTHFLEASAALPHLRFCLYGVGYGERAREQFRTTYHIDYRGWVPNAQTPALYARSRLALHVFRQPRAMTETPGVAPIAMFEALATRTCLVTTGWSDPDRLLRPGDHYLMAETPEEMLSCLRYLLENRPARERIAESGYRLLLGSHTCRHRAEALLSIMGELTQGH